MRRQRVLPWLALLGVLATSAQAGSPSTEVSLTGRVDHARTLTLEELKAMTPTTVKVTHTGMQGNQQEATYTGVLLWTVLSTVGTVDEPGEHTFLRHTLLVRGTDGYSVALAVGELDPNFEGKQVLLAYAENDMPLPSLRLVVPADIRAGRSVHDVNGVEVR